MFTKHAVGLLIKEYDKFYGKLRFDYPFSFIHSYEPFCKNEVYWLLLTFLCHTTFCFLAVGAVTGSEVYHYPTEMLTNGRGRRMDNC